LMAKAVEAAGGVSALTGKQLEQAGAKAAEAAEKMRKLGLDVPRGIQDIADAAKQTDTAAAGLNVTWTKLVGSFITAQAIIVGVKTAFGAFTGFVKDSIQAASEAEKSHVQLVAALRAQGTALPSVVDAYGDYAAALQQTTTYQDDALEAAEALLVTIGGVMPRDMEKALKATTDLAAGLGIDLETATRMVAKAAEGNTAALGKAGVVIDEATKKSGDFGKVLDKITDKFGGQAAAIAGTYQGRLTQLGNTWNDVQESIGRAITQNETVLTMFGLVNGQIASNTGELKNNLTVTNLVSDAVILSVRAFAQLAKALDVAQTVFAATMIGMRDAAGTLGNIGIAALQAGQALALMRGDIFSFREMAGEIDALKGAVKELDDRNAVTTRHSVDFGNALQLIGTRADQLQAALDKTRGRTVALTDVTDGATDAWSRHTQSLAADEDAAKAAAKAEQALTDAIERSRRSLDVSARILARDWGPQNPLLLFAKEAEVLSGRLGEHPFIPPGFLTLPPGIVSTVGKQAAAEFRTPILHGFQTLFKTEVPNTIIAALTGGGNPLQALGATIGKQLGTNLSKHFEQTLTSTLGQTLGNVVGGLLPGLGTLVGSLIGELKKIGGPSQQELQGRSVEKMFEESFGGSQAAGDAVSKMYERIIPAYQQFGLTVEDARREVDAMFAAERQGGNAVQQHIDQINKVLERQTLVEGGVGGVVKAYQDAGAHIPAALKQSITDLTHMTGLTDLQRTMLGDLVKDTRPNFASLEQDAARLGISLGALGPAFQQGALEDKSKTLHDRIQDLIDAGGDLGGILDGTSDEISDIVQESLKFGTKIPDNMKPWIQRLIDSGKLLDDNGDKITDMSGLSFEATPLDKAMLDLTASVQSLVDLLSKDATKALTSTLPAAAAALANNSVWDRLHGRLQGALTASVNVTNLGNFDTGQGSAPPPKPPTPFASGGLVTPTGGVQHFAGGGRVLAGPWGTDTVPAMLSPGEMVLTRSQQHAVGALLQRGAGGDSGALIQRLDSLIARQASLIALLTSRDALLEHTISRAVTVAVARAG